MSYKKSIRKHCLWCMNNQAHEVKLCKDNHCSLHEHRMNCKTENQKLTPLKAIHARCVDCHGRDTINCKYNECDLYFFRTGHNANLKGKRGNLNIANIKVD